VRRRARRPRSAARGEAWWGGRAATQVTEPLPLEAAQLPMLVRHHRRGGCLSPGGTLEEHVHHVLRHQQLQRMAGRQARHGTRSWKAGTRNTAARPTHSGDTKPSTSARVCVCDSASWSAAPLWPMSTSSRRDYAPRPWAAPHPLLISRGLLHQPHKRFDELHKWGTRGMSASAPPLSRPERRRRISAVLRRHRQLPEPLCLLGLRAPTHLVEKKERKKDLRPLPRVR
jgi:hypothetical protein